MNRNDTIEWIQERIEQVLMRAQGIGDGFIPDHDPHKLAEEIFDTVRDATES